MKRIRNIAIVTASLLVVGWMAVPAEASHRHRGFRGHHHIRPHHQFYRAPHHLHHHHRFHGPRVPHHFRGHYPIHPRSPVFVHPYAPLPGVGVGVYGPRGGFHFRF